MRFIGLYRPAWNDSSPFVCIYLGYTFYVILSHKGALPHISVFMEACVYGLRALVFLLQWGWQYVFWLVMYLLPSLIHAFILPLYSFWKQDDFSWGKTRIVVEERG